MGTTLCIEIVPIWYELGRAVRAWLCHGSMWSMPNFCCDYHARIAAMYYEPRDWGNAPVLILDKPDSNGDKYFVYPQCLN